MQYRIKRVLAANPWNIGLEIVALGCYPMELDPRRIFFDRHLIQYITSLGILGPVTSDDLINNIIPQ